MNKLPEEILESVLYYMPHYADLYNCALVCQQWKYAVRNVIIKKKRVFNDAIERGDVTSRYYYDNVPPSAHSIGRLWPTERFHHAACYYDHGSCAYDKSIYVFGGSTAHGTMYNDMWRLDMRTHMFERVLINNTEQVPPPKAGYKLFQYEDTLLLTGGFSLDNNLRVTHSPPTVFIYSVPRRMWIDRCMFTTGGARGQSMRTHSASVMARYLVMYCINTHDRCEVVQLFHIPSRQWLRSGQCLSPRQPEFRYFNEQVTLDGHRVLLYGGVKYEPADYSKQFLSDFWLLSFPTSAANDVSRYEWQQLRIGNTDCAPPLPIFPPAIKVRGRDVVIMFGKCKSLRRPAKLGRFKRAAGGARHAPHSTALNTTAATASAEEVASTVPGPSVSVGRNRCSDEQQSRRSGSQCPCLYCVHGVTLYHGHDVVGSDGAGRPAHYSHQFQPSMQLYALDLTSLLRSPSPKVEAAVDCGAAMSASECGDARWLPVGSSTCAPSLCTGYSLVMARGELVMFAGSYLDIYQNYNSDTLQQQHMDCISNTLVSILPTAAAVAASSRRTHSATT